MEERNRNQGNQSGLSNKDLNQQNSQSQWQNAADRSSNQDNPQRGSEWSNYRTRELSSNEQKSEYTADDLIDTRGSA